MERLLKFFGESIGLASYNIPYFVHLFHILLLLYILRAPVLHHGHTFVPVHFKLVQRTVNNHEGLDRKSMLVIDIHVIILDSIRLVRLQVLEGFHYNLPVPPHTTNAELYSLV